MFSYKNDLLSEADPCTAVSGRKITNKSNQLLDGSVVDDSSCQSRCSWRCRSDQSRASNRQTYNNSFQSQTV